MICTIQWHWCLCGTDRVPLPPDDVVELHPGGEHPAGQHQLGPETHIDVGTVVDTRRRRCEVKPDYKVIGCCWARGSRVVMCFLVVTYRWHWVGWSLNWWCGWVRTLDTHTVHRHWLPRPGSSERTLTSPRPPAPSPGCPGSCSGCSAPAGAGSHPARCASTRKPDESRLYCIFHKTETGSDFLRKWTTRKYFLFESQARPRLGLGCAVQFYFFDAQPQVNFNLAKLRIVISFCMYGSGTRAKTNIIESWLIIYKTFAKLPTVDDHAVPTYCPGCISCRRVGRSPQPKGWRCWWTACCRSRWRCSPRPAAVRAELPSGAALGMCRVRVGYNSMLPPEWSKWYSKSSESIRNFYSWARLPDFQIGNNEKPKTTKKIEQWKLFVCWLDGW